jgi:hypothetical protein
MAGAGVIAADISISGIDSVLRKAVTYYRSKRLLIVGQERCGKTRLFDYINSRILYLEEDNTPITTDEVRLWFRRLCITQAGVETCIDLENIIDESGQAGPFIHADLVKKHRPDILFILLDLTLPLHGNRPHEASLTWFAEFSKRFNQNALRSSRIRKKLKSVCILLNKNDRRNDTEHLKNLKAGITELSETLWRPALGMKVARIIVEDTHLVAKGKEEDILTRQRLDSILIRVVNNAVARGS